jgi:DNA-binding transcriptional MerR regulator
MEKVRYMISDASSMVNVESHVLRYWEDELELNIPRNEMGHRYYTQENIKEFQYIKELKEKGYQLKAIKMIVHNGDMEQRLPELTGNEADKPGGVKNHQVYFKNPETLALAEAKQSILDNTDRMAQFTELMTDIVGKAIAANNENLSRTISEDVGEQVLKEMNYLMREREELEEERFRQLDEAIRGNLKKKKTPLLKKWTKKKPSET